MIIGCRTIAKARSINRDEQGDFYPLAPSASYDFGVNRVINPRKGVPLWLLCMTSISGTFPKNKNYISPPSCLKRFTCMFFAFCRFVSLRGWLVPVMKNASRKFDPGGNFHEVAIVRVCREDGRCPGKPSINMEGNSP